MASCWRNPYKIREIAHPVCLIFCSYFSAPPHPAQSHNWITQISHSHDVHLVQKIHTARARPDAPLWLSLTVKLIESARLESKKTQKSLNTAAAHPSCSSQKRVHRCVANWSIVRGRCDIALFASDGPIGRAPLWQLDTQGRRGAHGHAHLSAAARVKSCSSKKSRFRLVIYFYCCLIWITNRREESLTESTALMNCPIVPLNGVNSSQLLLGFFYFIVIKMSRFSSVLFFTTTALTS